MDAPLPENNPAGNTTFWRTKKTAHDLHGPGAGDSDYDGEESNAGGSSNNSADEPMEDVGCAERKAAWLLMKLSMKDGEFAGNGSEGPRIKRRRATSM